MYTGHTEDVKITFLELSFRKVPFKFLSFQFLFAMKGRRLKTNISVCSECCLFISLLLIRGITFFLSVRKPSQLLPPAFLYLPHILALSLLSFYLFLSLTLCLFSISTVSLCFPGFLSYPTSHPYLSLFIPPTVSSSHLPCSPPLQPLISLTILALSPAFASSSPSPLSVSPYLTLTQQMRLSFTESHLPASHHFLPFRFDRLPTHLLLAPLGFVLL